MLLLGIMCNMWVLLSLVVIMFILKLVGILRWVSLLGVNCWGVGLLWVMVVVVGGLGVGSGWFIGVGGGVWVVVRVYRVMVRGVRKVFFMKFLCL